MKLILAIFLMSFVGMSYAQTNIPYGSHDAEIVNEMLKLKRSEQSLYFKKYIEKVEAANTDQNLKCKAIKENFFNSSKLTSKCYNTITNKRVVTLKAKLVFNEMAIGGFTYMTLFTHKLKKGNSIRFPEF